MASLVDNAHTAFAELADDAVGTDHGGQGTHRRQYISLLGGEASLSHGWVI